MRKRLGISLAAVVWLCAAGGAAPTEAAPITFGFTGSVTQATFDPNDPSGGDIRSGTAFTGSYTFESTAADVIPGSATGAYVTPAGPPYQFNVSFGGDHVFSLTDGFTIGVADDNGGVDAYTVLACAGGSACSDLSLELFFTDFDSNGFAGDTLPLDPSFFSAFEAAAFVLRGLIDGNEVEILGRVDSLACGGEGCVAPQPVPEPGTLLLLSPALAAMAWRRRRGQAAARSEAARS